MSHGERDGGSEKSRHDAESAGAAFGRLNRIANERHLTICIYKIFRHVEYLRAPDGGAGCDRTAPENRRLM
jgi:hypothetical protein